MCNNFNACEKLIINGYIIYIQKVSNGFLSVFFGDIAFLP